MNPGRIIVAISSPTHREFPSSNSRPIWSGCPTTFGRRGQKGVKGRLHPRQEGGRECPSVGPEVRRGSRCLELALDRPGGTIRADPCFVVHQSVPSNAAALRACMWDFQASAMICSLAESSSLAEQFHVEDLWCCRSIWRFRSLPPLPPPPPGSYLAWAKLGRASSRCQGYRCSSALLISRLSFRRCRHRSLMAVALRQSDRRGQEGVTRNGHAAVKAVPSDVFDGSLTHAERVSWL